MTKILYVVIDGKVSGGNNICVAFLEAARQKGYEVELLTPCVGELTDCLKKKEVPINILSFGKSFHFHKALKLAQLIKSHQINLVHTHTSLSSEIICRLACIVAGIPIICHQHDPTDAYNSNPIIATYQRWLDRRTSTSVSYFISVSQYRHKTMIQNRGYEAERVKLIYNGIDIESFSVQRPHNHVRSELNVKPRKAVIGLIGRLEPAKGQGILIEAIPIVLERHPQSRFYLIGDDHLPDQPSLHQYRQMIQDLGLDDVCFLLGFRTDIPQLIQELDIIVVPSLWENHPLIILESLAAEKPVIASSVGGIPEIITDRETGLLIPSADSEALARAICHLLEQPELAKMYALQGREKVENEFSKDKMIDQMLSIYQQVIPI